MRKLTEADFWARVNRIPDGCWEWTGPVLSSGYGSFGGGNKKCAASRAAYVFAIGPIPEGLEVCHACDNRLCVRPSHLWAGSRADNLQDMIKKGHNNHPRGERHRCSRFTSDEVLKIRSSSESARALAERYGVSSRSINAIRARETWRAV